jgi:hypothetical protein
MRVYSFPRPIDYDEKEDSMPRIEGFRTKRRRWIVWLYALVAACSAMIVYASTAHRTIDWWFGSSYALTAMTFGVHPPPGSLLLTLLGWAVARPPVNLQTAFQLNLFAGIMGAMTCCLVILVGLRLLRYRSYEGILSGAGSSVMALTGLAAGSLYLAFSETMWRYSVIFMPYVLTALFTVFILWAVFAWWRRETGGRDAPPGDRMLFLLMLLFGLDLSVHRTNLLLLPGFLLWVLICRPQVYMRGRSWLSGAAGLALGLSFHLLLMPIAARDPALNIGDASTWRRFYEYISLQQYGGGWLVNMWPRQGSFGYQMGNYLESLRENLLGFDMGLTTLPLVLFVLGMGALGRRDSKLLAGILLLFLFASLGAVLFFNVPDGYIFPMGRHYIPSFLIFGLLLAVGAGSTLRSIWMWRSRYRLVALLPVLVVILLLPVKQVTANYRKLDGSRNYFAYDFADNILRTVGPGAIVIVQGDNYWPVYYMQAVEGMRPDVAILSESLLNLPWYVEQISKRYPDLPIGLTGGEIAELAPVPWQDTTVVTAVEGDTGIYRLREGLSDETVPLPDSIAIAVPQSIPEGLLLVGDRVTLRMIEENRWRRPIYFTIPPKRLRDHLRLEGLVWLLVPQEEAVLNAEILRENLFGRYYYRGYADPSVTIYPLFTRGVGMNLQIAFYYLASHEKERGSEEACRETIRRLRELVPFDRIEPQSGVREAIDAICQ